MEGTYWRKMVSGGIGVSFPMLLKNKTISRCHRKETSTWFLLVRTWQRVLLEINKLKGKGTEEPFASWAFLLVIVIPYAFLVHYAAVFKNG
jgi:fatty acid desaturase